MNLYVCVCVCVNKWNTELYMCACVCCVCMCMSMDVCVNEWTINLCVCVCVRLCVCMCGCACVCVYACAWVRKWVKHKPVCVWMNHKAPVNKMPMAKAANAIPTTVPESRPSMMTLCWVWPSPLAALDPALLLRGLEACVGLGSVTKMVHIRWSCTLTFCTCLVMLSLGMTVNGKPLSCLHWAWL